MKIRLARDEDYAAMARLHRQTIRKVNSKDYSQDQIDVWSARPSAERFRKSAAKCKRWVAIADDKVVGFCDHGFDCELWGLYIHKDYIGKGIGSRLIKIAEDSLKKHGCKRVTLKGTITAKADLPAEARQTEFHKVGITFRTWNNPSTIDPQDFFSINEQLFEFQMLLINHK